MAENNKTRFFYVLYSDKTRVFDQSERAYYPIYIINFNRPGLLKDSLCIAFALYRRLIPKGFELGTTLS